MIDIRPIQPEEIPAVKRIILKVAFGIFGWDGTLEDSTRQLETSGEFDDLDHVRSHYFDNDGLFLVALSDGGPIGSGALRKLDDRTAELKRMWLLEDYHGQGIGYQLITRLFDFARARGYTRIVLQTGREQTRALAFYQRVGFHEIPSYNEDLAEVSMEFQLSENV